MTPPKGRVRPLLRSWIRSCELRLQAGWDPLKFKEEMQKQYQDILDPEKLTELGTLEKGLSSTLKSFVPEARGDSEMD